MPELRDILETTAFAIKKTIHDCVSDGTDDQSLLAGVAQEFSCNCAGYEYLSVPEHKLWDSVSKTIKNGTLNTTMQIKLGAAFNVGTPDSYVDVEVYIPAAGGDIQVAEERLEISSKKVGKRIIKALPVYNSQDALDYGFKIRLTAEVNTTVSQKSIYIEE